MKRLTHKLSLFFLSLFVCATSYCESKNIDLSLQTIEKIKDLEKRFTLALTQTQPENFESQRQLLQESFNTFKEAVETAKTHADPYLIRSVVKLADMLIDNDQSESTSDQLYELFLVQKKFTSQAIEQLEASSAKKLKLALKARREIRSAKSQVEARNP